MSPIFRNQTTGTDLPIEIFRLFESKPVTSGRAAENLEQFSVHSALHREGILAVERAPRIPPKGQPYTLPEALR
ncbi:MAG: hypothetical protein WKF55_07440 [Gemmatimonadaceae bacterium]